MGTAPTYFPLENCPTLLLPALVVCRLFVDISGQMLGSVTPTLVVIGTIKDLESIGVSHAHFTPT
eukprot:116386-Amphidinium_carterae.2